ncbi:FAD-binding oxidoreductase [Alkalinema sp. FACHB-956]|uniref:NAD(P)/FAD-dependent oxidoreductase n=1 Tax=Alkalinema sp. FACHB-956 TaxID=2692768 RepID=UPI001684002D|nr:FAD-binding oxidoreductase [Alkalinema sp. FACHB-956]MBD2325585.1 FAD-binding oxidoreductase [Alkalinema sp. FACHB-956]
MSYDAIVIGGGITGAALGYELANQGIQVLLIEQYPNLRGATQQSYGGIAYWAGETTLTQTLCAEGIAIHRQLPEELEAPTEFRELELLMPIAPEQNLSPLLASYAGFAIQPTVLTPQDAQEREPLLALDSMVAALALPHAQVHPVKASQAYRSAMVRRGGTYKIAQVDRIEADGEGVAVVAAGETLRAAKVIVCAGSLSRQLLRQSGIALKQYFSYAESIEIPPSGLQLRTIVMAPEIKRFSLEAQASTAELDPCWDEDGHQLSPPILDAGAVQFADGTLRIGQISRTITTIDAPLDPVGSEQIIRNGLRTMLPAIADLPGTWNACTVAFSRDHLPLVGPIVENSSIHLFSGFSNPLVLVPPLARRFALAFVGQPDPLLAGLSPQRFN